MKPHRRHKKRYEYCVVCHVSATAMANAYTLLDRNIATWIIYLFIYF